jgi:four helix bundle protein
VSVVRRQLSASDVVHDLPSVEAQSRIAVAYVSLVQKLLAQVLRTVAASEMVMSDRQIRSYRDLDAWNVTMDLTVAAYALASQLPSSERYELSSQIRRAATSVPSNIAEGQASGRDLVFLRHLSIALGSLGELDTHLEAGRRLRLLQEATVTATQDHIARTRRLFYGVRRAVRLKHLKAVGSGLCLMAGPALWFLSPFLG